MPGKNVSVVAQRISGVQKNLLLELVEENTEVLDRFVGVGYAAKKKEWWQRAAVRLNSVGGAMRTGPQWEKCLKDMKTKAKSRAVGVRKYASSTGGGPGRREELDPESDRLLQLMGGEKVTRGNVEVPEAFELSSNQRRPPTRPTSPPPLSPPRPLSPLPPHYSPLPYVPSPPLVPSPPPVRFHHTPPTTSINYSEDPCSQYFIPSTPQVPIFSRNFPRSSPLSLAVSRPSTSTSTPVFRSTQEHMYTQNNDAVPSPEATVSADEIVHPAVTTPDPQRKPKKKKRTHSEFNPGGTAVALSIICYPFVSPALRRICLPYVPATTKQVENVLEALRGRSGPLLDIGSGDGRIVIAAAKAGFPSHGVELNPWLVAYSRVTAATSRLPAPATFSRADLWRFPLQPYKNIVVFGVEEMMAELESKLDTEMQKEACVVACRFPLPGKIPRVTLGSGVDTVWVYTR